MGAHYRDCTDSGKLPAASFCSPRRIRVRQASMGVSLRTMTAPATTGSAAPERDIYSVSRLNSEVRKLLEQGFARIWLEGDLSNIARPSSGHLYFSMKDAGAQIRGAMFRNRNQGLRFRPEEGLQVLVRARVSLYEPRGDYQLIVDHMDLAGDGAEAAQPWFALATLGPGRDAIRDTALWWSDAVVRIPSTRSSARALCIHAIASSRVG